MASPPGVRPGIAAVLPAAPGRMPAQDHRVGRLDWDVQGDPRAAELLRGIARDGARRR